MNLETLSYEFMTRVAWTATIIVAGLIFYRLMNSLILRRARSKTSGVTPSHAQTPILLYFTSPTCAPCKTTQRPAIQRLQERIGDRVQVIEVDASARPEVANQWGVLSVPTTFIIDAKGQPRHVNHGVATTEKLLRQVSEIL